VLLPGSVIGVGLAWLFAAYFSDAYVEIIVGLIGVAFVLNTWIGHPPALDRKPSAAGGMFWGSLSGFTSTLVLVGAPPYQIHMLPQRLDKFTFVGTTIIFFAIVT